VLSSVPNLQELRIQGRRPSVPAGLRIYAVGDIHGRLDLLDKLLARINADIAHRPTARPVWVFLGDYIDRGSSSRETIDRLIAHGEANETIFLKGNHEVIAMKCLSDRSMFDQWLRLGGEETLGSYGVRAETLLNGKRLVELQTAFHNALPQRHLRFFQDLQNTYVCGDFFFVHAGAKPDVELSEQKESDLLWIRGEFLSSNYDFGKIIVHGHTPSREIEVRPNRINIDTGAFATHRLTCLVLEAESLSVIDSSFDA
jgi:serine/threonine protein phosphatase 1